MVVFGWILGFFLKIFLVGCCDLYDVGRLVVGVEVGWRRIFLTRYRVGARIRVRIMAIGILVF